METAIEIKVLEKSYGNRKVLHSVSLAVPQGIGFGLIGPNGAGKTTLVKTLMGLVKYQAGEISLLGDFAGSLNALKRVGYLPERFVLPPFYTPSEYLESVGNLRGLDRTRRKRIPAILRRVKLETYAWKMKLGQFSKGMAQRVALASTLLHDPEILFLDEPTDGIDPLGRVEIREILSEVIREGKTVFLNSHLLSETEMVCSHVGIIRDERAQGIEKLHQSLSELGIDPMTEIERVGFFEESGFILSGDFIHHKFAQKENPETFQIGKLTAEHYHQTNFLGCPSLVLVDRHLIICDFNSSQGKKTQKLSSRAIKSIKSNPSKAENPEKKVADFPQIQFKVSKTGFDDLLASGQEPWEKLGNDIRDMTLAMNFEDGRVTTQSILSVSSGDQKDGDLLARTVGGAIAAARLRAVSEGSTELVSLLDETEIVSEGKQVRLNFAVPEELALKMIDCR